MAKALVVYDSEIDHTEKMAKAIGARIKEILLSDTAEVR